MLSRFERNTSMTINERIEAYTQDMVRSLQEIVSIRSLEGKAKPGMPFGEDCARALDYTLGLCQHLGLRTGTMDGYIGWCEYGDGEELVCVLTHLDIVPEGDGWTFDPLGGDISEGKIYGRGTLDDKGPAIACIYALKALADSGTQLNRRIRILFGLNEETGCRCVEYYVNNGGELPIAAFTPDGEFPIINGEKGIYHGTFTRTIELSDHAILCMSAGTAPNVVPATASCTLNFRHNGSSIISAQGKGAHASTPDDGENAIAKLFLQLEKLPLDGDSGELTAFMAKHITADNHGRALGIYCYDDISGEITVNCGMMNIDLGEVRITLDIRCPVTIDVDTILPTLRDTMALGGFTEKHCSISKSIYTAPDSELVQTLQRVYERETGTEATLLCIGGGTYAKSMPNCVAFGPMFPGEPMLDHQPDECISIESLVKSSKLYAAAMQELAK